MFFWPLPFPCLESPIAIGSLPLSRASFRWNCRRSAHFKLPTSLLGISRLNIQASFLGIGNPTRLLCLMSTLLRAVLANNYGRKTSAIGPISPFTFFRRWGNGHPDSPLLITARREGISRADEQTFLKISRECWRDYIAGVRTSDTSARFRYLP